nr:hypothetical protein [Propionicimonas sp.]
MKNLCVGLGVAPLALVVVMLPGLVGGTPPVPETHQAVAQCAQDCPTTEPTPAVPEGQAGR